MLREERSAPVYRQLEFTFRLCFEWSVPNNGQLVFTCHSLKSHPQYAWLRGVSIKLSFQINTILHRHFPPVKQHYPLAGSDPFLNKFRYLIVVSRPSQNVFAVLHS